MTRPLLFAIAAVAVVGLAACDHEVRISRKDRPATGARGPYKTVARLDCPENQGDLKRTSATPDGQHCTYAFEDKTEVELRLTPLAGDEVATLAPLETQLRTLVPPPPAKAATDAGSSVSTDGDENAHIRLPGLSIDAEGDRANINVGGLHIDGRGDHANISIQGRRGAGMSIIANDGGAEIRQNGSNDRGVRKSLILAGEKTSAAGYRLVGYEARGPKAGPLVVAVVRARGEADTDYVFKDMKALVRRNVGG